jgi:universal stress protein A
MRITMQPKLETADISPKALAAEPTIRLAKLLVPVDFSVESKNALRYAGAFAHHFGASLTLLHVLAPIVCTADFGYGPVTTCRPDQEALKKARARLRTLGKKIGVPQAKPLVLVRTGTAETEIVEAARELETDLIIMGTRGNCQPPQPATSNTAESVLRDAPCPVLLVRKKEHEFVSCRKSN